MSIKNKKITSCFHRQIPRLLLGWLLISSPAILLGYTPAPPGAMNVSQFGAVGDGVTNDSVALRNAANWAALNSGDLAFTPGSTYAITNGMFFDGGDNFHVYGQDATLRVANGHTPSGWNQPIAFNDSNDFSIRDLTIDGNRANRSPAESWSLHNVVIQDADRFLFESVRSINATTDGFFLATYDNVLTPSGQSHDGLFLKVVADNAYRNGMSIVAGHDIDIVGSTFKNSNGVWPQAGIDIEPDPGMADYSATGITFLANRFEDNVGLGLLATGFHQAIDDIDVDGNYFRDNRQGALQISSSTAHAASNVVIHGNNFYGQHDTTAGVGPFPSWETYGALRLSGTNTHVVVTDNLFADIHFDHNGNTPGSSAPVNPPVIWEGAYGFSNTTIAGNQIYDFDNGAITPTSYEAANTIDASITIADPGVPTASDFDGDSDVDGADFLQWQRSGFSKPLSAWHLTDWTNNFGNAGGGAASSSFTTVPEPGAGILALIGVAFFTPRLNRISSSGKS